MNTVKKWIVVGMIELILCFWLLANSANLVSAPSNFQVWLGVVGYSLGLVIIPGLSLLHITTEITQARRRQQEMKEAFPGESWSILELLDRKSKY